MYNKHLYYPHSHYYNLVKLLDYNPMDVLPNSTTGHLVPPGDAHAMAGRVLALLADDGVRREMGESAAEDAARRFGVERMVGDVLCSLSKSD